MTKAELVANMARDAKISKAAAGKALDSFADSVKKALKKKNRKVTVTVEVLDTLGQRCPQPILQIAMKAPYVKPGDILEVLGDCPTFEKDVRTWCERLGRVFLSVKDDGGSKKRIQIQL